MRMLCALAFGPMVGSVHESGTCGHGGDHRRVQHAICIPEYYISRVVFNFLSSKSQEYFLVNPP